jgi:hypothetical protein
MKSHDEMITTFTEYVKRVYDEHLPKQSPSSMGDYIKHLKQHLELIESEISSERRRLLNEASANPAINIESLSDHFFGIVESQHNKWMSEHKPK